MPRIRQYEEQYSKKDFRRYVRARMAIMEVPQYELGEYLGISDSRVSQVLDNPERIPMDRMRKMIQFLRIEPEQVLRLLGYTDKQINAIGSQTRKEITL